MPKQAACHPDFAEAVKWRVRFAGVLMMRALPLGVYISVPDFLETPFSSLPPLKAGIYSAGGSKKQVQLRAVLEARIGGVTFWIPPGVWAMVESSLSGSDGLRVLGPAKSVQNRQRVQVILSDCIWFLVD